MDYAHVQMVNFMYVLLAIAVIAGAGAVVLFVAELFDRRSQR